MPGAVPLITPVSASTDTINGSRECQFPPAVADMSKPSVPLQSEEGPTIVAGSELIVMIAVRVQPTTDEYVTIEVPATLPE